MITMEFLPDCGAGPLWTEDGKAVDLNLLGLPDELVEQLTVWNHQYAKEKVPLEGSGDTAWLGEGTRRSVQLPLRAPRRPPSAS